MTRLAAVLVLVCAACRPDVRSPETLVPDSGPVAAFAPTSGGGLRFGELKTGRVMVLSARGRMEGRPLATVEVSDEGQRGLLGLATSRGRTFAAWTRPDGALVVGQLDPGEIRIVWRGPDSRDVANGGHIAFHPDGSLLIAIGDLEQPELTDDAETVNGKILRLDPDGAEDQRPEVVSSGWNNPFAFAVTPSGDIWVADNAPGTRPERLANADRSVVVELPAKTIPAGLAAVDDDLLVLCAYGTRLLQPYRITDGTPAPDGPPRATDCRYGVAIGADGRIVYGAPDAVRVVRL